MSAPIITSLLDTDLYKLTMMQCVLHQFPQAIVAYTFKNRTPNISLAPYLDEINAEIDALCALRFTREELAYLSKLDYIKPDFIDFLRIFQLNRDCIQVSVQNDRLHVDINGPWLHTIMFEVPVLAIINEVYFRNIAPQPDYAEGRRRLREKLSCIQALPADNTFIFSDFGTRRRFSKTWQKEVIQTALEMVPHNMFGTSNILYAKTLNTRPVGTMAHEFLQACQQLGPRLIDSQKYALEAWVHEYRGRLGIALTDVINIDAFLRDFDLYFAKLFDGLRQDSGDPFEWAEKVIQHYHQLHIDPRTKTLVFSDALTVPKAIALYERFQADCHPAFGIGTNLTNDLGPKAIQIVIKMTKCNGHAVAKLSDTPGKNMCDDTSYVEYLRRVFQTKPAIPKSDTNK